MIKFKRGDKVRNLKDTTDVPEGATGIVDENNNMVPYVIWDTIIYSAFKNARRARYQDYLELIKQENPDDPLDIIGRKMKGFKFENGKYSELDYDSAMDKLIGKEGEIISYRVDYNCYNCQFGNNSWHYPAELIMQHIIEEPKKLNLLEKFQAGWQILLEPSGVKAVQVIKSKNHSGYIIEWDEEGAYCYIGNESYITCTPPKETVKMYIYDTGKGLFPSTVEYTYYRVVTIVEFEKESNGSWKKVN